jgi:hypothetical protein
MDPVNFAYVAIILDITPGAVMIEVPLSVFYPTTATPFKNIRVAASRNKGVMDFKC